MRVNQSLDWLMHKIKDSMFKLIVDLIEKEPKSTRMPISWGWKWELKTYKLSPKLFEEINGSFAFSTLQVAQ